MRLFGRGKPNVQTLAFPGAPRTDAVSPTAQRTGRSLRNKPDVRTLAQQEDVEGLVEAASYEDFLPGRDGRTVDLGARVREEAILALGDLEPEACNETVAGALTDPSDRVRVAAVRVLCSHEEGVPLAEAIPWLPRESGDSRQLALQALAQLAKPECAPTLAAALLHARADDPVGDEETALLATLVELEESSEATTEVIEELLSALADVRAVVADRAEDLLAKLAPASIEGVVSELEAGAVPHRAASVLGRIADTRALDPLMEALRHREARVRAESAAALGKLRDPAAVEPLLRATRDPDADVRAQAGGAIDRIGTVALVVGVSHLLRPVIQAAVTSAVEGRPALTEATPALPDGEYPDDADERWARDGFDPRMIRRLARFLDRTEDACAGPDQRATAEKIDGRLETGSIQSADNLTAGIPSGLVEITRVPGLGPKRARLLHDELGVASLDDLRQAAEQGRVKDVPGFGKKAEENLRAALAAHTNGGAQSQTPEQRALVPYRQLDHLRPDGEFGPYYISGLAGRGEGGVVYKAIELPRYRPVALKVLDPELSATPGARDRLLRSSRIVRELDHPHVVPVYDSGEIGGRLFVAMHYVPGTDLKRLIREQGQLEPQVAVRLVTQIASALDAAAEGGLCHPDLKPTNVLVAGEPPVRRALLSDFGRDPVTDAAHNGTGVLRPVASLDYVAPERFAGKADLPAIAVYALGCVLFEALTGSTPFADTPATLEAKRAAHEQRQPAFSRPGFPHEFEPAIARALAKDPAERFRTAGQLAAAAQSALSEQ
jgi:HEAT repeat protein